MNWTRPPCSSASRPATATRTTPCGSASPRLPRTSWWVPDLSWELHNGHANSPRTLSGPGTWLCAVGRCQAAELTGPPVQSGMLTVDPRKRLTAAQALLHPWILRHTSDRAAARPAQTPARAVPQQPSQPGEHCVACPFWSACLPPPSPPLPLLRQLPVRRGSPPSWRAQALTSPGLGVPGMAMLAPSPCDYLVRLRLCVVALGAPLVCADWVSGHSHGSCFVRRHQTRPKQVSGLLCSPRKPISHLD